MTGMASSNATSRAEYERQLVEQALGRGTDPEDEPDGNDYMNAVEAKAELRRKTLLQTHRPEAELSVQRQRVMIGAETATSHRPLPPRPVDERSSQSAPNITISYSDAQLERSMAAADVAALRDDDEDEDMPLALLQVQGFASRDRPASRAVGPAFGNTLHPQSSGQARARPSTAGLPVAARPKSELPPFAKKLPQDPFQAAGRSRESTFVASRDRAASMYSYPSGTSTSLPAGGLIGVIAHEERARALRRGSNINLHQTGYFTPAVPPQEAPAAAAPARGSSEALVRQLGENMLMLQTQMQQVLMSQARQQNPGPDGMHGNSTGLGTTLVPPSFQRTMTMPAVAADHRPASYAASNFLGSQYPAVAGRRSVYSSDASALAPAPRMSMASSPFLPAGSAYPPSRQSMYRQHHSSQPMLSLYHQQEHEYGQRGSMAGVYTPSIAPSERSNVGQASRYRPVSQHALGAGESAAAGNKAASAIAASKPLGPKARRGGTTSVSQQEPVAAAPSARLKAVDRLRAVSFWGGSNKSTPKPVVAESDSSEEEGWASMKKQQRTQHGRVQHRAKHSESPSLRELYPHGL